MPFFPTNGVISAIWALLKPMGTLLSVWGRVRLRPDTSYTWSMASASARDVNKKSHLETRTGQQPSKQSSRAELFLKTLIKWLSVVGVLKRASASYLTCSHFRIFLLSQMTFAGKHKIQELFKN